MARIKRGLISILLIVTVVFGAYLINRNKTRDGNEPLCKGCNVLWISMDTLSANHLPCYGYGRDTAPNLCGFAQSNFLFKNAYSNSYWTLPSFVSEFTGVYPSTHKVMGFTDILEKNMPVLPEILKNSGYTNNFRTSTENPAVPVSFFAGRGLDSHLFVYPWKSSLEEFEESVKKGEKTFLFIHDYSVHPPYLIENRPALYTTDNIPSIPHSSAEIFGRQSAGFFEYLEKQIPTDIESGKIEKGKFDELLKFIKKNKQDLKELNKYFSGLIDTPAVQTLFEYMSWYNWEQKIDVKNTRQQEYIKALYDQKIHEVDDSYINEALSLISDKSIKDNTIFIFSSEHGEEFGEHGQITHKTIYNSNIRVPLIIYVPNLKGKIITTSVQLADLVPTILELVGIKNNYNFEGKSLVPLLKGENLPDRILEINGQGMVDTALIWRNWKLFVSTKDDNKPFELYDLSKDPGESNNILFSNLYTAQEIIRKYKDIKKN